MNDQKISSPSDIQPVDPPVPSPGGQTIHVAGDFIQEAQNLWSSAPSSVKWVVWFCTLPAWHVLWLAFLWVRGRW